MTRKKVLIGLGVVVLAGAMVWANFAFKKQEGPAVNVEAIKQRNLESIVSASGKIRARRTVNISADRMGRVTRLAVEEGDKVKSGQFLLQIDPRSLRTMVTRGEANLEAQRTRLQQARVAIEAARVDLKQAQDELARQQALGKDQLATKQALDAAETTVKLKEAQLRQRESELTTADQVIRSQAADLENARHDLSLVTIESPIDGIVTKRNIEEGETAVMGTMNQPGTVLLTIADMSVIEAEIEVDETDIPTVQLGQKSKVTIDALPDRSFSARVTEIGNSPINSTSASVGGVRQATTFKVVVTIDEQIPDVRPGFTCTSDITTATRTNAVSVPIQALTVRELTYDASGKVVKEPPPDKNRRPSSSVGTVEAAELKPGYTKKETEGVFVVDKDNKVQFVPVKTGIAGDKYFEVLSGLKPKDRVITGPFTSVRNLKEGGQVKIDEEKK